MVWRTRAVQEAKVSNGHYEVTCVYYDCFWKKGLQDLETHFANNCRKVLIDT